MLLSASAAACTAGAAFRAGPRRTNAQPAAPRRPALRRSQGHRGVAAPRVRATAEDLEAVPEPETARGAIAVGLRLSNDGQWERAQQYFERALELPGTGLKRWRDKPPQLSPGELQAALYNIACCRSKLGDVENGLIAMAGAVEQGYRDFAQLRSDPDLEGLRGDERFEGLLRRFEPRQRAGGFLGLF